jgi:hypothetical protein
MVGFALAYATIASGSGADDLRKTIVTSLLTVLATVAGFYFGALGAQNSAEAARGDGTTPAAEPTPEQPVTPTEPPAPPTSPRS